MKKLSKLLILSPVLLGVGSGLTSCSKSSSSKFTLKIINSEDYIYLNDGDPESLPDMTEQFKNYVRQLVRDGELDAKYKNVEVVYDTSDTNETLYSELQTGKSDYDLINVSDYMAQKIVSNGLAVPLYKDEDGERRADKIPNYENYASSVLKGRLDEITTTIKEYNKETKKYEDKTVYLKDYAVGYMWGTLGILFNPKYHAFSHLDPEQVKEDMHYSYNALWNKRYNGTISIKNSMRDTYAVALMKTFESEFEDIKNKLDAGEITQEEYMEEFTKIFNRCDEKSVNKVAKELEILKKNIFGLEVDSGKQDIVTGKIGINLAWSGDAVYAMDQAEDEELVGSNTSELYYSVPELGSNLWFDTWVMPKNSNRSEERRELALMFLDFISNPENAAQNMDYTGYTSFIGGDAILELIRDWYDMRTDELYCTDDYYQVYAVGTGGPDDFKALDYDDCMTYNSTLGRGHNASLNDYLLYYFVPTAEFEEPENVAQILAQDHKIFILNEEGEPTAEQKTYGDLLIVDEDDSYAVDLSYFFNGTLEEYEDDYDTVFYSDNYLVGDWSDGTSNISVGRQFFVQYPDERTLNRCAVMRDYGENNKYVMKMWEEFKSDPLPTPAIVVFAIIIASAIGLIGFIVTGKVLTNRIRKKRKAAQNQ